MPQRRSDTDSLLTSMYIRRFHGTPQVLVNMQRPTLGALCMWVAGLAAEWVALHKHTIFKPSFR